MPFLSFFLSLFLSLFQGDGAILSPGLKLICFSAVRTGSVPVNQKEKEEEITLLPSLNAPQLRPGGRSGRRLAVCGALDAEMSSFGRASARACMCVWRPEGGLGGITIMGHGPTGQCDISQQKDHSGRKGGPEGEWAKECVRAEYKRTVNTLRTTAGPPVLRLPQTGFASLMRFNRDKVTGNLSLSLFWESFTSNSTQEKSCQSC